jgi:integrase
MAKTRALRARPSSQRLIDGIGLEPTFTTTDLNDRLWVGYGTHSLRRTKASIIYRATGNLRAVPILLGQSKIENTLRYLGIDVEDALALAENTEI